MQIHNTVGIDEIRAEVFRTNATLTKLVSIVEHKSEREEQLEQALSDLGGRKKVLGNDELLTTMAKLIQERAVKDGKPIESTTTKLVRQSTLDSRRSSIESGSTATGESEGVLDARERHELRISLDTVLKENAEYYVKKLDAQVALITNQIAKVQRTSDEILRTLQGGGSYERIAHPHIRAIWKEMVSVDICFVSLDPP